MTRHSHAAARIRYALLKAPVRRFLRKLIDLVEDGKMDAGKVFDLTLPLDEVVEGYRAMDDCRAIKALLQP